MLALVERYFDVIRKASSDADIIDLLRKISGEMGLRSGYLIEYANGMKSALHVLDSNGDREGWWDDYMSLGLRTNTPGISAVLSLGGVQVVNGDRFTDPKDPLLIFARKVDLVECTLVPVSHGGEIVGLGGFSGNAELDTRRQMALQVLVYALFSQVRTFRNIGVVVASDSLTPREKEVIGLSADGLTSTEIARRLGMSPRTVNQHVDNVANKLGTKNRAHTVAEAIRHDML